MIGDRLVRHVEGSCSVAGRLALRQLLEHRALAIGELDAGTSARTEQERKIWCGEVGLGSG